MYEEHKSQATSDSFTVRNFGNKIIGTDLVSWPGLSMRSWHCSGRHHIEHFTVQESTLYLRTTGHVDLWVCEGGTPCHYSLPAYSISIVDRSAEPGDISWLGKFTVWTIEIHTPPSNLVTDYDTELLDRPLNTNWRCEDSQLLSLLDSALVEIDGGHPSGQLYRDYLSLTLISYIYSRHANCLRVRQRNVPEKHVLPARVRREILDYINSNLTEDLSLPALAGLAHVSPHHFAHLFKNTFGQAPHQFVIKQRIAKAKRLLRVYDLPISEVALAVGYSSQSHFSTAFRKIVGRTPRLYRMEYGPSTSRRSG